MSISAVTNQFKKVDIPSSNNRLADNIMPKVEINAKGIKLSFRRCSLKMNNFLAIVFGEISRNTRF